MFAWARRLLSLNDTTPKGGPEVVDCNDRGVAAFDRGHYEAAIGFFTKAIDLDPEYAPAFMNRGSAWAEKREYSKAQADFSQAIRLDPNHPSSYHNRGLTFLDAGDCEKAIADFNEVIRLAPDNAAAYADRGAAWSEMGTQRGALYDYERAIADCNRAIQLEPNNPIAHLVLGTAWAGKGDQDRAMAEYAESIRLNPKNPKVYYNRGNAFYRKGLYDNALADYTTAIELNPVFGLAFNNRGLTFAKKGAYVAAIADYDKATALSPDFSGGYYNRARLEATCGQKDSALEWLAKAIERNVLIKQYARKEPDFCSLRSDPRFPVLVGRFLFHEGGPVVVDSLTGLMWRPSHDEGCSHISAPEEVDFHPSVEECVKVFRAKADRLASQCLARINEQAYAGFSDWRVPTIAEAESLVIGPKRGQAETFVPFIDELFGRVEATWTCEHQGVQFYYDPDGLAHYPVAFLFVRPS